MGKAKAGREKSKSDEKIKHVEMKVNYKNIKCKKLKNPNKVLQETENDSFIEEPKNNNIIVVHEKVQETPNKKSKNRKKLFKHDTDFIDEPKLQEVTIKKSKKRNKASQQSEQNLNIFEEVNQQAMPSTKTKKRNKYLQETEQIINEVNQKAVTSKKNKKQDKILHKTEKVIREPKGKKIIFVDDEQEAAVSSGKTNNVMKKLKFLNDDEAKVGEEDIDKFCDELDDEDNMQYEEWIKLIEANLHSKKKKPN